MLQINSTQYPNKTKQYISPALKDWGDDFLKFLNTITVHIAGIGINDAKYYDYIDDKVFLCVKPFKQLTYLIDQFRDTPAYFNDYKRNNNHMLVINLPEEHKHVNTPFVFGKYSQMYSQEAVDRLFPKSYIKNGTEMLNSTYRILTKDTTYGPIFQDILKKEYGVKAIPRVEDMLEFDTPPNLEDEIFDFNTAAVDAEDKQAAVYK